MDNFDAQLESKLRQAFQPEVLVIRNVSHRHAGHAGSPGNGHSHYEVELVSQAFQGLNRIGQHRKVYQVLAQEMAETIHALALTTSAPGISPSSS